MHALVSLAEITKKARSDFRNTFVVSETPSGCGLATVQNARPGDDLGMKHVPGQALGEFSPAGLCIL
jgi:hypothetical protein